MKEGQPCPIWPRCACILQGYTNRYEPNNCGKKPATTKAGRYRHMRDSFVRVLGRKAWRWHREHNPQLFR